LDRVTPILGATFSLVMELGDDGELLRPVAQHEWPAKYRHWIGALRVRVGDGPSGVAVAERRLVEVEDLLADPSLDGWHEVAEELGFRSTLESDLAPLHTTVQGLINAEVELHCLRDLTRGGLASAADEIARAGGYTIELEEEAVPVELEVRSACNLLGLDPLSMANEGRMLVICPASEVDKALTVLRRHNAAASKVGTLKVGMNVGQHLPVVVRNSLGILRPLDLGRGEQLPRIC
jgi:hypothetical protein